MMARRKAKPNKRRGNDSSRRMVWRQVGIGVLLAVLVAALLTGIWHLTRLPAVTITDVTASGGITIAPAMVTDVAEAQLTGTYYRLIPKRFSYLYPESTIRTELAQIARIKDIAITKPSRTSLAISFTEYEPFALWCDGDASCVFIDTIGYGFAEAPSLRGGALVRYQNPEMEPTVGVEGIPPAVLRTATTFIDTAAVALNFRPQVVSFDDRDIIYQLGGGGEIRTSRTESIETTLANLETVLESDDFAHIEPGNFEYIDLRYGNKVFVQETVVLAASSTPTTSNSIEE